MHVSVLSHISQAPATGGVREDNDIPFCLPCVSTTAILSTHPDTLIVVLFVNYNLEGFDIVLTIMQFATIYFPITPNFFTSDFLHNGMQQESKMICKSIKIRSDAHITFNLDRIAIILGTTGSFAALAGLRSLLERIMGEKTWRFLRMVRPPNRRHSLRN